MQRPLEGIRVIDCGIFHAGPGASAILGDLGAEIIKIEQPVFGDPIRLANKIGSLSFDLSDNRNLFCEGANRNKKSITVNLSTTKGQEIVYQLVKKADVFMTNMRKPAVEKLNITYPIIRDINPNIIYASISAYGEKGPDSDKGGFDYQGQARSGLMYCIGEKNMPEACQFGLMDQATAINTCYQIITALLARERLGVAQKVSVSILGSSMALLYFNIFTSLIGGPEIHRHNRMQENPLRNSYKCKDDRWIMMTIFPKENVWESFCQAINHTEFIEDTRFNANDKRMDNADKLIPALDAIFLERTQKQWLQIMDKYDLFCCAVNSVKDLADDPQVVANEYIVDFKHPTLGNIKIPGYPAHFSETPAKTVSCAPELGQHTDMILTDICGFKKNEIKQMKAEGIV